MTKKNLNTRHTYMLSVKRARGRGRRRRRPARTVRSLRARTSFKRVARKSKLSGKLEALKKLIPAPNNGQIVKADQLFQETANYIVLLRTRALILQKLIEFYGTSCSENENNIAVL